MECVKAEAGRYRRARRQREDDPAEHKPAERRQQQPIDGPPPIAERRSFHARDHAPPPNSVFPCSPDSAMVSRRLTRSGDAGSARTRSRNLAPRTSKFGNWSKEAQAGDSRTTGCRAVELRRHEPQLDGTFERHNDFVLDFPPESRKFLRCFSNQIGLADTREKAGQRGNAAGLRLAAGDPKNVIEAGERAGGSVGISRLGIIDEQNRSPAADLLQAVGEPGKERSPRWIAAASRPSASAAPVAQAAFCALCTPRSESMLPRWAIGCAVPPLASKIASPST